jgi:hypothetical protein
MTSGGTWVVDGANVMGARPDGWWRDRPGAAARLHGRILRLLAAAGAQGALDGADGPPGGVVLVLEGHAKAGVAAGTVWPAEKPGTAAPTETTRRQPATVALTVEHAPGEGDDAIVAAAVAAGPPVVAWTSDRALRARLIEAGAHVRGAGALWALLDKA